MLVLSFSLASLIPGTAQTTAPSGKAAVAKPPVTLKIGDNPPPIVASKWLKGEPVTAFKPGHVYVIEFWATWCGPCRIAMPHLSEMAREYKGKVTFIGFDVQELNAYKDKSADYMPRVENFVKNLGNGMDYTVAADVPEGTMYHTWMRAAGLYGIPSTFVIDQQGKISWTGHPMELDGVLPLVLEGKLDENARKLMDTANKDKYAQIVKKRIEFDSLRKSGRTDEALNIANWLIDQDSYGKPPFIIAKYELLKAKGGSSAIGYAKEVKKKYDNNPIMLQVFADTLSKMESKAEKELAVKMTEQVLSRIAPDDFQLQSSIASVYFNAGDAKKAVALQEKVVALLFDATLAEQRQSTKDKAKANLDKYRSVL